MEDVLGPDVDDEQSLQQRYVLVILWFLQPLTDFGSVDHATALTSNIDECEWTYVECDGNGYVTALYMGDAYMRGQIPPDLNLSRNQLFGTIPSSLGTLTALSDLWHHTVVPRHSDGTDSMAERQSIERNHSVIPRRSDGTDFIVPGEKPFVRDHSVFPRRSDDSRRTLAAIQSIVRDHSIVPRRSTGFGKFVTEQQSVGRHDAIMQLGPSICKLGSRLHGSRLYLLHRMLPRGVWQYHGLFIL
jgi:hypothetical protein